MIPGQVTVTVTPNDDGTSLLDCTDCGPMGVYAYDGVSTVVYEHMTLTHRCNTDTIDIHQLEP